MLRRYFTHLQGSSKLIFLKITVIHTSKVHLSDGAIPEMLKTS